VKIELMLAQDLTGEGVELDLFDCLLSSNTRGSRICDSVASISVSEKRYWCRM
jgi:hypothetical protein